MSFLRILCIELIFNTQVVCRQWRGTRLTKNDNQAWTFNNYKPWRNTRSTKNNNKNKEKDDHENLPHLEDNPSLGAEWQKLEATRLLGRKHKERFLQRIFFKSWFHLCLTRWSILKAVENPIRFSTSWHLSPDIFRLSFTFRVCSCATTVVVTYIQLPWKTWYLTKVIKLSGPGAHLEGTKQ